MTVLSGISLASFGSLETEHYVVTFICIIYLVCVSPFLWKWLRERPHLLPLSLSMLGDDLSRRGV